MAGSTLLDWLEARYSVSKRPNFHLMVCPNDQSFDILQPFHHKRGTSIIIYQRFLSPIPSPLSLSFSHYVSEKESLNSGNSITGEKIFNHERRRKRRVNNKTFIMNILLWILLHLMFRAAKTWIKSWYILQKMKKENRDGTRESFDL